VNARSVAGVEQADAHAVTGDRTELPGTLLRYSRFAYNYNLASLVHAMRDLQSAQLILIQLLHVRSSRSETRRWRNCHASGCKREMYSKKSSQHGDRVVAP